MERSGLVLSESGLRLLLRALRAEARRLELEIAVTRERIRMFEEKYGMSSEEFMSRYTRGELGDDEEFMEWYGELVFLEKAVRELEELRKIAGTASQSLSRKSQGSTGGTRTANLKY